jgi:hypothetical protein
MTPIVMRMPNPKRDERINALSVLIFPWPSINPTISGMQAIWHGDRATESTPQTKAAVRAI